MFFLLVAEDILEGIESGGEGGSDTDGSYLVVQNTANNGFNIPTSGSGGGAALNNMLPPWSQAQVISSMAAPAVGTSGATTNLTNMSVMMGDNKLAVGSLVNNLLQEGYDPGMSLPSLPSIGEDFPSNMQSEVVMLNEGGQGVGAEETVASADTPPSDGANDVVNSGMQHQQGEAFDPTLRSLDRKLDEFQYATNG